MKLVETGVLTLSKYVGLNRLYQFFITSDTIVLMYHGIAEDEWEISNNNWLQVTRSQFLRQMKFLKRHYHVVSFEEALRTFGLRTNKPKAVITFDDGYVNNYTVAYPILKKLELPATIFLVSSMIDTTNLFWYDRLRTSLKGSLDDSKIDDIVQSYKSKHPHVIDDLVDEFIRGVQIGRSLHIQEAYGILTLNQIHEMQNSGLISFDSHTHRHEILTSLNNTNEAIETIGTSLEVLRGYGIDCGKVFCYPNGLYKEDHFNVMRKLDFQAATNTVPVRWDFNVNQYEIPRFGVGRNLNCLQFEHLITGLWKAFGDLKQGIQQPFSFVSSL